MRQIDIHRISHFSSAYGLIEVGCRQVPSAFRNSLWLLAPPKKLEPGQHDLLHEAEVQFEEHAMAVATVEIRFLLELQ